MKSPTQLLALVALLISGGAVAGEWYGDITYTGSDGDLPQSPIANVDNSDSGWQLSAGYDVNKHFAVEFGYVDYGEQTVDFNAPIAVPNLSAFNPFTTPFPPNLTASGPIFVSGAAYGIAAIPNTDLKAETTGLRLATIGKVSLASAFELNVQAGALVPRYKVTREFLVFDTQPGGMITNIRTESRTETSNEPEVFFGLGVHWAVNPTMGIKVFWEKINDLGNEDTIEQDVDTYNLALRYQF